MAAKPMAAAVVGQMTVILTFHERSRPTRCTWTILGSSAIASARVERPPTIVTTMSSGSRRGAHQGRTTAPTDEPYRRPRKKAVTVTAWLIIIGLTVAVVGPVLAILFS
jgi:hypothetical protein